MKIGILTYFSSINCGAFLQAYSLWRCLCDRYGAKAEIEIINYESRISHEMYLQGDNRYKERYAGFIGARKKIRLSYQSLITDDLSEVSDFLRDQRYDLIIVGSDEVWKTNGMRGFPSAYWLNFDVGDTTKMAYAVSGRNDYGVIESQHREYMKEALDSFLYIGVRDTITGKEIETVSGREARLNCDPTVLGYRYFTEDKCSNGECVDRLPAKMKTVFLYAIDPSIRKKLFRMLRNEYYVIDYFEEDLSCSDKDVFMCDPFAWSSEIAAADFVITAHYHGMLFSIIHQKPFVCLDLEARGRGKISDFIIRNHLESNLVSVPENEDKGMAVNKVYTKTRKMIREGIKVDYLNIINDERALSDSFFETLDGFIG